ncbi:MAG TPA: sugar phosphate isomerase/epimerase family protein [Cyclobacteriaceae bacterium]|nr:sugar phosphate isomerase/epimerase family protein [Cyclobacteriaceae bacterium]
MNSPLQRRKFIKSLAALPAAAALSSLPRSAGSMPAVANANPSRCGLKIGLNAFSFNDLLLGGKMTIDEVLDYCAEQCIDAVDLTGYYFPGYPAVPPDEYIYHVRKKAFRLGLEISGTGVRNNFTESDEGKRRADISLIKYWIEVAAKLGAPVIRVFAGEPSTDQFDWDQVAKRMAGELKECVGYGKAHGVVVAIQNHNDFIRTAAQVKKIMALVDSEWLGLHLDIGSYREGDPYEEIRASVSYAVNWQIKENVYFNGKEVPTDFDRLTGIIRSSSYRGYLPLETLGPGNPKIKLAAMLEKLRNALN